MGATPQQDAPDRIDPKERLIFALDVSSPEEALRLVRLLREEVRVFKIGLEAFLAGGFELIDRVAGEGGKIFLDLKLLDIPATVNRALRVLAARRPAIDMATIHILNRSLRLPEGGEAFSRLKVLAVTVLTSLGEEDQTSGAGSVGVTAAVLEMARRAREMGCAGVIASGREARVIRENGGEEFLIVTPGIRPAWSVLEDDDQKRIVTPGEAIGNGADQIVVGRPIRNHPRDQGGPLEAARKIQAEIAAALIEKAQAGKMRTGKGRAKKAPAGKLKPPPGGAPKR